MYIKKKSLLSPKFEIEALNWSPQSLPRPWVFYTKKKKKTAHRPCIAYMHDSRDAYGYSTFFFFQTLFIALFSIIF